MGHLYAIRGWVEGESEIVEGVRRIVGLSPLSRYWHFSDPAPGEHGFAFFGAVVESSDCGAIQEQLRRIAAEVESNYSDINQTAVGYFHVACLSRSEGSKRWRIGSRTFAEEPLGDAD